LKANFYGFTIMAIEQGEIEKIAELSRIRISDEEIGQVTQRIAEILQMVDQLQAVDTPGRHPTLAPG
jgi:aspartyl-tRNA(Asn)/glutamyl-tRNA(Gln) amidotransferase subunit C